MKGMRPNFSVLAGMSAFLGLMVCGYALMPVEGDGLRSPEIRALAKHRRTGSCGYSSNNSYSISRSYEGLRADARLRAAIDSELIAEGYVKTEDTKGVRYRKKLPGMLPIYTWVQVRANGDVFCGGTRRKWPL